jgi:cell division protease FtsH
MARERGSSWNTEHKKDGGIQRPENPLGPMNKGQYKFSLWFFAVAAVALVIANSIWTTTQTYNDIDYSRFRDLVESGEIRRVEVGPNYYRGFTGEDDGEVYRSVAIDDPGFIEVLEKHDVDYYGVPQQENPLVSFLVGWLVPFLLLMAIWRVAFNRLGRAGPDVLSLGRNRAQIVSEGETGVRFEDVAGSEEAKLELQEVVEFLRQPEKYAAVGGRVPKGVLMVGAPGTGKTLLARAVAGEAGVPFFRMSGADFVEMFVGVGAARVRDLFRQAREKAPCIIFIDELDAIGKSRAQQISANDEREQTLNQLLVEMDGFDARSGVIVLAATNRPEVLDPALLRPGRFDRQVLIDKPDLREREAIEKAVAGLKKKNRLMNPEERRRVAYHEAGHALVSYLTPGADPVQKVSIVPRGFGALGYTLQLPTEERYLLTEQDLLARVDVLLAGRAAEEVVFGSISTGASDDISKATDVVRRMFTEYGMSEEFKNVYLPARKGGQFLNQDFSLSQREFSEETQRYIDTETARLVAERYSGVLQVLRSRREALERIAGALLEREVVGREELGELTEAQATDANQAAAG